MSEDFNLMDAANEITSEEAEPQDVDTQELSDGGQTEGNPSEGDVDAEMSAEEILKNVGQEKQDTETSQEFLDQINQLGAIHKGMPISINNLDQLTELIQKGFDYTQKTMAHAEEVKSYEEKVTQLETQHEAKVKELDEREMGLEEHINENQIVAGIMNELKVNDPDLFEEFAQLYQAKVAQIDAQRPYQAQIDNQIKELSNVVNNLKTEGHQKELQDVREGWDKELKETQGKYAASLAKIGVKVDWDKVKDAWAGDTNNSLSVEDALFAAHGKDIQAANNSRQKMLTTRTKTQNSILKRSGMGGANRGATSETQAVPMGNYESLLQNAAANM